MSVTTHLLHSTYHDNPVHHPSVVGHQTVSIIYPKSKQNQRGTQTGRKILIISVASLSLLLLAFFAVRIMEPTSFTTNAEDQAEAAKLKARLKEKKAPSGISTSTFRPLSPVKIASGTHKYVLISAHEPGGSKEERYFVTSKKGAQYHRNAADPFVHHLEEHGYEDIQITGGGRILLDEDAKKISIYGFSYGFGLANHSISKLTVLEDERYANFDITTSDEGY